MVAFIGLSTQPVFRTSGNSNRVFPVVGAKIYTYDAGTNTPRTAYADGLANTEHDWPFLTDANGCIPPFWVVGAAIKVVITSSSGTIIRTIDDIPGDTASASVTPGTGTTIPPGFMMEAHQTGTVSGWVRANGRTIGSGSSGATERANADTADLFTVLWNDALLSVSGGRGISAAADFAANKTIELPDRRGRAGVGLADMGNSISNRLDGVSFAFGGKTTLGSTGGASSINLSVANLPPHTHTGTTAASDPHTHSASSVAETPAITVNTAGDHGHSASQDPHDHSYTQPTTIGVAVQGGAAPINSAGTTGGTTGGASASAVYVSNAGDHTHTASQTAHNHTITVASDGAHTHTFTTAGTGSGTAFENVQPFMLTTVYIKL